MTPKPVDTGGVEGGGVKKTVLVELDRGVADRRAWGRQTSLDENSIRLALLKALEPATEKPTDSMGGEKDKENGAADASRSVTAEAPCPDCGGPMILTGMGNPPECRQSVILCPEAELVWRIRLGVEEVPEGEQQTEPATEAVTQRGGSADSINQNVPPSPQPEKREGPRFTVKGTSLDGGIYYVYDRERPDWSFGSFQDRVHARHIAEEMEALAGQISQPEGDELRLAAESVVAAFDGDVKVEWDGFVGDLPENFKEQQHIKGTAINAANDALNALAAALGSGEGDGGGE